MSKTKDKIEAELDDSINDKNLLADLVRLLNKYYNPDSLERKQDQGKINSNTSIDYIAFVKHLVSLYNTNRTKKNHPSIDTIRTNLSYISKWEIDVDEEQQLKDLFKKDSTGHVGSTGRREKEYSGNELNRFRYSSYLAIKKYLRAMEKENDVDEGEYTRHLPKSSDIKKPKGKANEFYISRERVNELLSVVNPSYTDEEKYSELNEGFEYGEMRDVELLILLGANSGMRINEILNLQLDWITFYDDEVEENVERTYIELPDKITKPGEDQKVYVEDSTSQVLREQLKEIEELRDLDESDEPVYLIDLVWVYQDTQLEEYQPYFKGESGVKSHFTIQKERHYSIQILEQLVNILAEEDGGDGLVESRTKNFWGEILEDDDKNLTPHVLRHSFLQYVYDPGDNEDLGADIKRAKIQGRHKNVETTMNYLEGDEEEREEGHKEIFDNPRNGSGKV
jgi:integrase